MCPIVFAPIAKNFGAFSSHELSGAISCARSRRNLPAAWLSSQVRTRPPNEGSCQRANQHRQNDGAEGQQHHFTQEPAKGKNRHDGTNHPGTCSEPTKGQPRRVTFGGSRHGADHSVQSCRAVPFVSARWYSKLRRAVERIRGDGQPANSIPLAARPGRERAPAPPVAVTQLERPERALASR
jgi:hypothetical protein